MSFVQTVAAFIVALAVLIVVHEYGHYLAARLCHVRVLRFSVGFGRSLFTWRSGADKTEWVIAAIPFGGYVKMLDEREGDVDPGEVDRAFNRQSVWKRVFIVVAGPAFNFLFAVVAYTGLFMHGVPEARPIISAPVSGTAAALAGFKAGDTVRRVDGRSVATWQDLRWKVVQGALQQDVLHFEVISEKQQISLLNLDLRNFPADEVEGDAMERVGLRLYRPPLAPVLGKLVPGGRAEQAGLRTGDTIRRIDGQPITGWGELVEAIRTHPGRSLKIELLRDGREIQSHVIPEEVSAGTSRIGRIGAAPNVPSNYAEKLLVRVRHGLAESVRKAVGKTYDISEFSLRMMGRMLIGQVSWKHLSGPVTIADFAGQSAQAGWLAYVTFLALISISLGVLNLLPIPLLDGGHLMYYLVEIIKGSPVSERTMELGQRVGLALLLVMMAFAFYNDLNRLFSS